MVRVEEALAAALPDYEPREVRRIETGWDSVVLDIDGEWILRVARRERVAARYALEARLLPELAPLLPLPVPVPVRTGPDWILTRRLPGEPFDDNANVAPVGDLIAALHAFPVARLSSSSAFMGAIQPRWPRMHQCCIYSVQCVKSL